MNASFDITIRTDHRKAHMVLNFSPSFFSNLRLGCDILVVE
jgi:hypothetical protein